MSNKLDQIQIPVPCASDWEEMTGNDRIRYCAECKKNVYNLSKMTRREAEALIATKRGGLCARIVRNPDGTIHTETLPAILPADGRRASPVAAALVMAIMGLSPNAVAHPSSMMHNPAPGYASEHRANIIKQDSQGATTTVAGAVLDMNGDLIQGATVKLINTSTEQEQTFLTSENGKYSFSQVEAGSYTLRADAEGFAPVQFLDLAVKQGEQQQIDLTMGDTLKSYTLVSMGESFSQRVLPLRQLYEMSEMVVVARAGKSVRVQAEGEAGLMKTRLKISSSHKGPQRARTIDLYHWVYGEKDEIYNRGGNLLFFLKSRQGEQPGYELSDSLRGVKELSEDDLQEYLEQIDDLAWIMSKPNPEPEEYVAWLVRCAEHPATRWDAVYDLDVNAETLAEDEIDTSAEEEEVAEVEPAEVEAVEEEATEIEPDDEDRGEKLFARLLTPRQKERLTQALFKIETITRDDMQFIGLVRRWDDGRLIPFLLSQLRKMEANPPRVAAELIASIANWLEDEEVMEAHGRYNRNVSYVDEDEDIDESEDAAAGKTGWLEARRNRGDMLREFIAVAESKIKK